MNPTVKEPKKRFMTLKRREACLGWLFVSPALIGFSIFTFGSILYSFYLSMTDYDLVSTPKWVGFDNYIRAFTKDQYFYKYFGNTLYFVVTLVPIVLALSLLLAILINKKTSWVNNIYRVALFLPSITSTVAVSMVWLWIEVYLKNRSNHFEIHLELKNIEYLRDFVTVSRRLGLRIDDIESNPAYVGSGLSVYTITVTICSSELKKYKTHHEIIEALKSLDYIYHLEELR